MITDPISDMLTRMRNALGAKHEQVKVPHSKVKAELARIFDESGYITKFSVEGEGITKHLLITLPEQSVITSLIRVSKPGRRIYAAADEIPTILSGRGMIIVSTSSGIMTGRDARRAGLGGELICKVW